MRNLVTGSEATGERTRTGTITTGLTVVHQLCTMMIQVNDQF